MVKEKIEMKELGKIHTKQHLLRLFPFLKKEFRPLDKKELKNEKTFLELFPNEDIDYSKLKAIYEYQK